MINNIILASKSEIRKKILNKNLTLMSCPNGYGHFLNFLSPYANELYGFEISKYEKLYKKQNINYILKFQNY